MKTKIIIIILSAIGIVTLSRAEMLHPWPREFFSVNRKYCIRVTPPEKQDKPGNCRAVMYEVTGTNMTELWSRFLPNNLSPSLVFISDDAEFILTIGDWSEIAYSLPVVVYHKNWLMVAHTFESLGVTSPGNMIYPLCWLEESKLFFGPKQRTFIILLKTGQPIVIDRTGDVWGGYSSHPITLDEILSFIEKNKESAKTSRQYMSMTVSSNQVPKITNRNPVEPKR